MQVWVDDQVTEEADAVECVRMIEKLPPCGVNSSAVAEPRVGDATIPSSAGSLGDLNRCCVTVMPVIWV